MAWVGTAVVASTAVNYLGSQAAGSAAESAASNNRVAAERNNLANIEFQKENNAANRAQVDLWNTRNDPFSAGNNREQYVGKLNELMAGNASDIYNDPIFQGNLNMGNEAISRRFAAGGNGGSGAEQINLMKYTTGAASDAYKDKFDRLASLSGATNGRSAAYQGNAPTSTYTPGMSPELAGGIAASGYNVGATALSTLGGLYGSTGNSRGSPAGLADNPNQANTLYSGEGLNY